MRGNLPPFHLLPLTLSWSYLYNIAIYIKSDFVFKSDLYSFLNGVEEAKEVSNRVKRNARRLREMISSCKSAQRLIEKLYSECLNEIKMKAEIKRNPLKIIELRNQNILGHSTSLGKKLIEGDFYGIYSYIDGKKAQLILYSLQWQKAFYMRLKPDYLQEYLRKVRGKVRGNAVTCAKVKLNNVIVYEPFSRIRTISSKQCKVLRLSPTRDSEIPSVLEGMSGIHASPSFVRELLKGNISLDVRHLVPVPRYPEFPGPHGDFAIPLVTLVKLQESIAAPQTKLNIGGQDILVEVPLDVRILQEGNNEFYIALLLVRPITKEATLVALAPSPCEKLHPSLDSKWDHSGPSVNEIISESISYVVITLKDLEEAMKMIENLRKNIRRILERQSGYKGKTWRKYKGKIRNKILNMIYILNESDRFRTFNDYYNDLINDKGIQQELARYGYIYVAIYRIWKRKECVRLLNPKFARLLLTYF